MLHRLAASGCSPLNGYSARWKVETISTRNARNGKKGGGHNKKDKSSDSHDVATAASDAVVGPQKDTILEALAKAAPASAQAANGKASESAVKARFQKVLDLAGVSEGMTYETATPEQLLDLFEVALARVEDHRKEMATRKSRGAAKSSQRAKVPADTAIVSYILRYAKEIGWPAVQNAIQTAWRNAEAPEGRVVFRTSDGPVGSDDVRDRSHLTVVKSA